MGNGKIWPALNAGNGIGVNGKKSSNGNGKFSKILKFFLKKAETEKNR
jgi:hypothetical protein